MTRMAFLLAITVLFSVLGAPSFPLNESIVGTWRLVSMTYRDPATGRETDLWGKAPLGFLTYTPGGRMCAVIAASSRKIVEESAEKATEAEQAMLFRTSFSYAGSWRMTNEGLVHRVEVASDPTWVGKDQIRYFRYEAKKLIITGPPLQTVGDPTPRVLQLVWERVE